MNGSGCDVRGIEVEVDTGWADLEDVEEGNAQKLKK